MVDLGCCLFAVYSSKFASRVHFTSKMHDRYNRSNSVQNTAFGNYVIVKHDMPQMLFARVQTADVNGRQRLRKIIFRKIALFSNNSSNNLFFPFHQLPIHRIPHKTLTHCQLYCCSFVTFLFAIVFVLMCYETSKWTYFVDPNIVILPILDTGIIDTSHSIPDVYTRIVFFPESKS